MSPFDSQLELFTQPNYQFLSRPPSQKKRPHGPLPPIPAPLTTGNLRITRRRSSTTVTISLWASQVQPGSPDVASPLPGTTPTSMLRRPSFTRRHPSFSRSARRPSYTASRRPSAPFLELAETPLVISPSVKDCKHDLANLGYSFALQCPLPVSPSKPAKTEVHARRGLDMSRLPTLLLPFSGYGSSGEESLKKEGGGKNILSRLVASRRRSKSISASPLRQHPSPSTARSNPKSNTIQNSLRRRSLSVTGVDSDINLRARTIATNKKAQYATTTKRYHDIAPPLGTDVALVQFLEGCSEEDSIKRVMQERAKKQGVEGVCDPYRDEDGQLWNDESEEVEFHHLLNGVDVTDKRISKGSGMQWTKFGEDGEVSPLSISASGPIMGERRGSTVSAQDSDLDPRYVVDVADLSLENSIVLPPLISPSTDCDNIAVEPGPTMLSVPCRSHHTAPHLRNPSSYILDAFTVPLPASTPSSRSATPTSDLCGKAKKRPAPLALSLPAPQEKYPSNSPDPKQDFLGSSFAPEPVAGTSESAKVLYAGSLKVHGGHGISKKVSALNLGGVARKLGLRE